ncbi:MAG: hypothetical protein AAGA60_32925 [Cyanobacteria bacterium P01_E01_bin.42]
MSNDTERIQDWHKKHTNRKVREYFNDIEKDAIGGVEKRNVVRSMLLHKESDSALLTMMRIQLWWELRVFGDEEFFEKFKDNIYGVPTVSFQQQRKFQPQIILHFLEDADKVLLKNSPVRGKITFRLMDETATEITRAKVDLLANRVKSIFGIGGTGLIWKKGRKMVTYNDWNKGYGLQLRSWSEAEGERMIGKVLDIQNHSPDWSKSNLNQNKEERERYPAVPGNQNILGESIKKPRERPIADVRFTHAELHLHGRKKPIILYDRTFRYVGAVVTD